MCVCVIGGGWYVCCAQGVCVCCRGGMCVVGCVVGGEAYFRLSTCKPVLTFLALSADAYSVFGAYSNK